MEHLSSYEGHNFTFTDGSKTEDGVGCFFTCEQDTRSFTLLQNSSVSTSELGAISEALCSIEVNDVMHLILSDSLSSLLALRPSSPDNRLIQDI